MKNPIFRKTDLSWIVDYDYDRSGCTCGAEYGICRCTTIENTWIRKVHTQDVVKELYRQYSRNDSEIDKYCFDRICYALKIYDEYLYEVETGGGYYGEEVYGVYFEDEEKIFNAYNELLALGSDFEKIQYCLKLEYGYLIDCVQSASKTYITEASIDEIILPQMEYFKKVDKDVIEEYKNRNLPIAVCFKHGDKYKLIDGYHRFVANKDRNEVNIIVLE